jgi:2-aminoethylphosphonate-pyruvate transaminase
LAIDPHSEEAAASLLLTPGPLTSDKAGHAARLQLARRRLYRPYHGAAPALARRRQRNGEPRRRAVAGSGTFIVEATIATLVGPDDKLLVLVNGAYGERMTAIARRLKRPVEILSWPEDRPVSPVGVAEPLDADPGITHVPLVHCATTTGLLKPRRRLLQSSPEAAGSCWSTR